jgi:hypothetical protein
VPIADQLSRTLTKAEETQEVTEDSMRIATLPGTGLGAIRLCADGHNDAQSPEHSQSAPDAGGSKHKDVFWHRCATDGLRHSHHSGIAKRLLRGVIRTHKRKRPQDLIPNRIRPIGLPSLTS